MEHKNSKKYVAKSSFQYPVVNLNILIISTEEIIQIKAKLSSYGSALTF